MTENTADEEITGKVVEDDKEVKKELVLLLLTSVAAAFAAVGIQELLMRKLSGRIKVP